MEHFRHCSDGQLELVLGWNVEVAENDFEGEESSSGDEESDAEEDITNEDPPMLFDL